jgi:type II secretory pathway pseudopilin PulG
MINRVKGAGYTIIEVMMFLAISGVLLLIAGTFINGQQQAAQFSQALNDFGSKIQDIVNNVATGSYPDTGTFTCTPNTTTGNIDFSSGTTTQGANRDCVFIGKMIQLAPQTAEDGLNIFTIVGRRLNSNGAEIQTLDTALPTPLAVASSISNTSGIDATSREFLRWGLRTTRIVTKNSHQDVAALAFISDFGRYGSSGSSDLVSGAQSVTLVLPLGSLGQSFTGAVNLVKSLTEADRIRGQEGAVVCFKSANNDRRGAVTISAQGVTSTVIDQTDSAIGAGICP